MIVITEKNNVALEKDCYISAPKIDISCFESVSLQSFYIEFFDSLKRNCLVDLCSSLIDKSVGNPNQIIGSEFLEKSTKFVWCNLASANQQYKIQCHSLEESFFQVRLTDQTEKKIKNIRIVLKFN